MSKTYIDSIIDTMPNAVWIVEVNPRLRADPSTALVIHLNPAAAALFVCPQNSLIGSSLPDLVSPVAVNDGAWWAAVTSGRDVFGVELDLIGPNRVEIPVVLAASMLPSRTGEYQHILCVAQDMTQRQLAEHLVRENDRLIDEITRLQNTLHGSLPPSAADAEQSSS